MLFVDAKILKKGVDIDEIVLIGKCNSLRRIGVDVEFELTNIKKFLIQC